MTNLLALSAVIVGLVALLVSDPVAVTLLALFLLVGGCLILFGGTAAPHRGLPKTRLPQPEKE